MSAPKLRSSSGRLTTCHVVREGVMDHECDTPYPPLPRGGIVECECGRQYISRRMTFFNMDRTAPLVWCRKWLRVRPAVTS